MLCRQEGNAQSSDLAPGDKVLVNQERRNKLSTQFAHVPYDVATRTGNSVVVQSPEKVHDKLLRNTTHLKKYEGPLLESDEPTVVPDGADTTGSEAEQEKSSSPIVPRPTRVKKLPERLEGFVIT